MNESDAFLPLTPHAYGLPAPLCDDIDLLDRMLGAVLIEQEGPELSGLARQIFAEPADADPTTLLDRVPELKNPETAQRLLRAFTALFQLINTAEQKEIVRVNRERQAKAGEKPRPESIGDAIGRLKEQGTTAEAMQTLLNRIDICPTLTAHPTEARRRAILDKLQRIAECLADRALPAGLTRLDLPLDDHARPEAELRRALTALWQTDELRATPITVPEEARNALYFFERAILDVVAWLHADVRAALAENYPGHAFTLPPFLTYRSWVGGDRDGNPNVTPEVTWRTLLEHRRLALEFFRERIDALRRDLTLSAKRVAADDPLLASLEVDRAEVTLDAERLRRYAAEPYALKLLYIHARLRAGIDQLGPLAELRTDGPAYVTQPPAYASADAFLADLELIQTSLRANKAAVLADDGAVADIVTQARAFGFHLATLDIRQHSDEHEKALTEVFAAANVTPNYAALSEDEKVRLLSDELANPRPLLAPDWNGSDQARSVLRVFDVVRHARRHLSPLAVTTYIISMTHGVSDILEALLLAKEARLFRWSGDDLESELDIVPLFETIDDLHDCDRLMRAAFANPAYRRHLEARGTFQEIMLGYSDSSKDGGFLAANWALHDTQNRIARCCHEAGIGLRLFHGRGGTVGRGGGRANRAILSQPPGSFDGRIRFTEQGEVISFRYSLPPIAHRHLEQIVSAALLATAKNVPGRAPEPPEWHDVLVELAAFSRKRYREMAHEDPDFWTFYTEATPIAHISRLPIASRPVSRSGKKLSGVDDLRAIPWVFAWVQSRYVLPGWYGVGMAFEWFANTDESRLEFLRTMYRDWLFFRAVIDNAQLELTRAHLPTAAWYAARTESKELGQRFHAHIAEEHERTKRWVLRVTEQDELLGHSPVVRATVALRNPAVMPLSKLQVALLEEWERQTDHGANGEGDPALREAILLSITGIAAAMQSTG